MARSYKALLGLGLALLLVISSPVYASDDVQDDEYADSYRAQLVVYKAIVQKAGDLAYPLVVQGRNATIKVTLYNMGSGQASNVELTDVLPPNAQLIAGSLTTSFAKIAPGSTVSHTYSIVFTTGGSMDVQFLPSATVSYTAEEDSKQVGRSTSPGVFVLTPVQQITRYALIAGSYASLGICRTPTEWRNMAVVLGIVGGLLGLNWGMKQAKTSSSSTKRRKALQELEKDE